MHKWWRDWAKFDIFVLGLGLLTAGGYVWYRQANPAITYSPYFELWSGIATGILGAWITVRILDAIVRARDKREQVRLNLISNLNYIVAEARKLTPRVYDFNIVTLENELKWSRQRFDRRKPYLKGHERDRVETVHDYLERTVRGARAYLQADAEVRARHHAVEDALGERNQSIADLESQLRALADQSPPDAAALAQLRVQLPTYSGILSGADSAHVTGFLAGLGTPNTYPSLPHLEHLYLHDWTWFGRLERAYREIADEKLHDAVSFAKTIADAQAGVTKGQLPAKINERFDDYFDALMILSDRRVQLDTALDVLISSLERATNDIMEESELD